MTDHRAFQIGIRILGSLILILGIIGVCRRFSAFYGVVSDPYVVKSLFDGPLTIKSLMYFIGPVIEIVIGMYFTLHSEAVSNLLSTDQEETDQHHQV